MNSARFLEPPAVDAVANWARGTTLLAASCWGGPFRLSEATLPDPWRTSACMPSLVPTDGVSAEVALRGVRRFDEAFFAFPPK